ncbi:hypothetical protein EU523_00170 [Candidatus Heimdallarchaeota archaeon]|nr:MAG: hypothetical protein EU523_00170 [Candidatus Heimdallarchaeota archaeon]
MIGKKGLGLVLIILNISLSFYYSLDYQSEDESRGIDTLDSNSESSIVTSNMNDTSSIITPLEQTQTPGNYKLRGFFIQDEVIDISDDGPVFEWEPYEDVKGNEENCIGVYFVQESDYPSTWPPVNTYGTLPSYIFNINGEYLDSTIFSPVFQYDSIIQGKVFFLVFEELYSGYANYVFTLRITMELFNPATQEATEIVSVVHHPMVDDLQKTLSATLDAPVTIPAGYRLRFKYEAKRDRDSSYYGWTELRSSIYNSGSSVNWQINDLNDTFDSTYTLNNIDNILGVQLYMYQDNYPSIDIYGVTDNEIYYESKNATVTVSDSILNRYKWDSNPFSEFDSNLITPIPETTGWHTLTVEALDYYDNLATSTYTIGYDSTPNKVNLNTPANNSLITDGQEIDLSVVDSSLTTYEWDLDGTEILLSSPFDIYVDEGFSGTHQLTIHVTTTFGTEDYHYFFEFDNSAPIISLDTPQNNSYQPPHKNIDVEITDRWESLTVMYKWDSDSFTPWTPFSGDIYRIQLPVTEGWHYLTVSAEDGFGLVETTVFGFQTDVSALLVDLENLMNNSYYCGGNDVEISIVNDNDTVKYFWGTDPPSDGIVVDDLLTLSGTEAIPEIPGTYTLTLLVGDEIHVLHEFVYVFTVDQESPEIAQTIATPSYNDSRFLSNKVFSFTITDNWTDTSILSVSLSIDGGANQSFSSPFNFYLTSLDEGNHGLRIFAQDLAGNEASYFITFTIDVSSPEINTVINGLAETIDETKYIPGNAEVTCDISDDDPSILSSYSWNDSNFIPFTNSFTLPDTEGAATLEIYVEDSLGNFATESYQLIIDNSPPVISLNLIQNHSKINEQTVLQFKVEDLSKNTLETITSQWDIEDNPTPRTASFTAGLLIQYQTYTQATIEIYAKDIVGNEYSSIYQFNLDFLPPTYVLHGIENNSLVKGNTLIDFEVTSDDLQAFKYRWNDEQDYRQLQDPYDLYVPTDDGIKELHILLEDDTGGGLYPNTIEATYIFIVDDINITFLNPKNFTENYYYTMYYGDTFTFTAEIKSTETGNPLTDINITIEREDQQLNLNATTLQINETIYEFSVKGTNVTSGEYSFIEFKLWQQGIHKQSIVVHFRIFKQVGNIAILESTDNVTYEDEISLKFKLNDNTNSSAVEVNYLAINNETENFAYSLIDSTNLIYQVIFDTEDFVSQKGQHFFDMYAESYFYYGIRNGTSAISINIQPIAVNLTLEVSDSEIVYGNVLAISAFLERLNDNSPVRFENVTFVFGIVYKNHVKSSRLVPLSLNQSEFDEIIEITTSTNINGLATTTFEVTEEMDYLSVQVSYAGNNYYDSIESDYSGQVNVIPPPGGLSTRILIIIIAGSVLFAIIVAVVVYNLVKPKPFEQLMEKITDEEINENTEKTSPGIILSIFDQMKGPIPLVSNHSLETQLYHSRMQIGIDNFLLKISDQAYSALGFEELDEKRRIGSINLPNEEMIGFIHGIQLENPEARGGFENLSLIVLADAEYGGLLLSNQEFLFPEIDALIIALQEQQPLEEIEALLYEIRRRSIIIMLAAEKNTKKEKKKEENFI